MVQTLGSVGEGVMQRIGRGDSVERNDDWATHE